MSVALCVRPQKPKPNREKIKVEQITGAAQSTNQSIRQRYESDIRALLIITAIMLVLVIPSAVKAQHKHTQSGQTKAGKSSTHDVEDEWWKLCGQQKDGDEEDVNRGDYLR